MGSKLNLSAVDWLFMVLLVVGGLNWGLVGLFQYDLVATLFGAASTLSNVVYILVGVSALYFLGRSFMSLGKGM